MQHVADYYDLLIKLIFIKIYNYAELIIPQFEVID